MAMNVSVVRGKGVVPTMNVTPLVDVVLVLLIIFMVMTPLLTKRFWIHTPRQEKQEVKKTDLQNDHSPPLVLHVDADRTILVNGSRVEFEELAERLRRMFAARDDHVLFFDADDKASYAFAVAVLDQARAGGAVTIATLTAPLQSPSANP
jgi:biopolymer transport protein ExbD